MFPNAKLEKERVRNDLIDARCAEANKKEETARRRWIKRKILTVWEEYTSVRNE